MELLQYERKVQTIGKSYLVTLPKEWCRKIGMTAGSIACLGVKETGEIVVRLKK